MGVDPQWPRGLSHQLRSKREDEDATVRVSASPTIFYFRPLPFQLRDGVRKMFSECEMRVR